METIPKKPWVGIDVSKKHWDVALHGRKKVLRFAADSAGGQQLMAWLEEEELTHVCLEATGGYEYLLVTILHEREKFISVVNPRQVRDFARARGKLAKTDQIDARIIAEYATLMKPKKHVKPRDNQEKLVLCHPNSKSCQSTTFLTRSASASKRHHGPGEKSSWDGKRRRDSTVHSRSDRLS